VTSAFLRLHTMTGALVGLLAVISVYMLTRGHHAPGGGFVGGLLFASAIAIQILAHGSVQARRMLRVDPRSMIALGLCLAAAAACVGLLLGRPLLTPVTWFALPGVGYVGTELLFDSGIYLLVAGATLTFLFAILESR
jgi:multisubunit Na+/H+ antiporter MnhB subunit